MSLRLTVVSGPSGVGKGTMVEYVRRRHPEVRVSVSATTRSPRAGEVDGCSYHFLSRARFEAMIRDGDLLEWAEYGGNLYGTPRRPVEDALAAGHPVILEIDVAGARQVRRVMPAARLVFVAPPDWATLEARLRGRGTEAEAAVLARLRRAEDEMAAQGEFDHIVVNDEVRRAGEELVSLATTAEDRRVPTGPTTKE